MNPACNFKVGEEMSEELSSVAVMDKPAEQIDGDVLSSDKKRMFVENEVIGNTHTKFNLSSYQKRYLTVKRLLDFLISLLALVVLTIPFALIAIIQKIVSPKEPVFFHQIRIGKNGQPFKLTKFRSMKCTAPRDCPTKDFSDDGQYITKWGRFLRDTSIDELPQLFQVISGKMSLIGPRPLIPQEESVHKMREQAGVYQLRPGMTGWAQINGRDFVEDEKKVELDRFYLQKNGYR